MMKKIHQTEFAYKIAYNGPLRQVANWQQSIAIYIGKDEHHLLFHHGVSIFDDVDALENGDIELRDVLGRKVTVRFLFMSDGAGRRNLHGVSSAASRHCMGYNSLQKTDVRNLLLFAPITRTKTNMERNEPEREDLDHKKRLAHARNHEGIYGANCTRRDLVHSPTDALHQFLLLMARLLSFTMQCIMQDGTGDVDKYSDYLRTVIGLPHGIKHVEKDGRLVLSLKGNDCRKLIDNVENLLPIKFMSIPAQQEAIMQGCRHHSRAQKCRPRECASTR